MYRFLYINIHILSIRLVINVQIPSGLIPQTKILILLYGLSSSSRIREITIIFNVCINLILLLLFYKTASIITYQGLIILIMNLYTLKNFLKYDILILNFLIAINQIILLNSKCLYFEWIPRSREIALLLKYFPIFPLTKQSQF